MVKLRFNAGSFVGVASQISLGTAVETGVEFHKYYIGASWFQNFVDRNCARLNFSVGTAFSFKL